jgi:hypothetical protein
VNAVKSKMASSKSTTAFDGDDTEANSGATGGSVSASATHDERLHHASDNTDGKK